MHYHARAVELCRAAAEKTSYDHALTEMRSTLSGIVVSDGNRELFDADGRPIHNPAAVALQDQMIEHTPSLP